MTLESSSNYLPHSSRPRLRSAVTKVSHIARIAIHWQEQIAARFPVQRPLHHPSTRRRSWSKELFEGPRLLLLLRRICFRGAIISTVCHMAKDGVIQSILVFGRRHAVFGMCRVRSSIARLYNTYSGITEL
jgi:hypothetical protein